MRLAVEMLVPQSTQPTLDFARPKVWFAASSRTITSTGANQILDVTGLSHLDLSPASASSFSQMTGGSYGQVLTVSANDLSTLNHGTTANAMELDLSQPLAVGSGGWDGIFRFNGVFWDQLGGSQK